ncbi:hypothetical protein RM704_10520 [Streptomyces sp. DSM 3412]|uniref:Uncharacterized protein n=1 Tax=Streptomyces gottesmaniae TaxID=3075518 RepID=A0ABU2YU92_9ACTN|nr:hypothetical protein [Streptomyces sp. DSM 3412]MDT0567898.1 hypothetical protein [Streptomyces sp. DSM 3412]
MTEETTAKEKAGGEAEAEAPSRIAGGCVAVVLAGVAVLALKAIVTVAPYVAYSVAGVLACLAWQKGRAWLGSRRASDADEAEERPAPDVGEALRRLVGDDNGVLLTRLRDDQKLPDTKVVKQLLDEAGIKWKAVRTSQGNGPGVHKSDIPSAPSPVVTDTHGGGCCCRPGDNNNTDNGRGEGAGEGIRVQAIGEGGRLVSASPHLEDLVDRFFAEAARNRPTALGKGDVNDS